MRYRGKKKQKPLFVEAYATISYKDDKGSVRIDVIGGDKTFANTESYPAKDRLHASAIGMVHTIKYAERKFSRIRMIMVHINSRRLAEIIWPFHTAMCPRKRHQKVVREIKSLEGSFSLRVKSTEGKYSPNYDKMFKDDPILIEGLKELGVEPTKPKLTFGTI